MSVIGRKAATKAWWAWIIGFSLIGAPLASAAPDEPPEGAKAFAEVYFRPFVEEMVFADRPGDWGFREEKGEITFSELYPIYTLNADFALGKSDDLLADRPPSWAAVIFQNGEPVNAIGTRQTEDGRYELHAFGYPTELPAGLLNVKEGEIILHVPPSDEYYVYSESTGTLKKLGIENGRFSPGSPQSVEQFRNMLMERYRSSNKERIGHEYVLYSAAVMMVLIGGAWLYFGRRTKSNR